MHYTGVMILQGHVQTSLRMRVTLTQRFYNDDSNNSDTKCLSHVRSVATLLANVTFTY